MVKRKNRDRGRILTDEGYKKIWTAIREVFPDQQKYAAIARWTDPNGKNPDAVTYITAETVSNILNRRGNDQKFIEHLFCAFNLTLQEDDHVSLGEKTQPENDPSFVGRERDFAELDNRISQGAKVIVIKAAGGVGKTTLARKYLQQKFGWFLEFPIAKETKDISSVEALLEEKLRQLEEEPGRNLMVSLDRLKRKLQLENIGILIDNLEPALNANGQFIDEHRSYVELLRILTDSAVQSVTLITSRERLREPSISLEHYSLEGLDLTTWEQFFQSRNINAETDSLFNLHYAYAGNAKAMDLLRGSILEDYSGDVDAYWSENQDDLLAEADLESLVISQFERLEVLDPNAYKLLIRMGCYRYQDVPTIPTDGLISLLWDIPSKQHKKSIKSLKDRSLIEGKRNYFWLHPVIRSESILRLRQTEYWIKTNQKAAETWQKTVERVETLEEALMALEAFYHQLNISDFKASAITLIEQRPNRWESGEPLGRSLYRLGLLKQTIQSINFIIEKIEISFPLSRLYNILGDLYWLTGDPHKAIKCHTLSMSVAGEAIQKCQDNHEDRWLRRLQVFGLFNISLCKLDLWELQEALKYAEAFKEICEEEDYRNSFPESYDLEDVFCYLAFLYSYLKHQDKAYNLLEVVEDRLPVANLDTWATGYSLLYLGLAYRYLDKFDKSYEIYNRAISFAKDANYLQVEAKALCGLSELCRLQGELELSIQNCLDSISIFEKIGAKSDLAEALFQIGLSYSSAGKKSDAIQSLNRSIEIFQAIKAPNQVQKVKFIVSKMEFQVAWGK